MKKFLALMLSLALVFALAACGQKDTGDSNTGDSSNTDASADWPKANTRYIITASAGGGLDICARMLAPYWEKATDNKTVVTVENVTGGANWIGSRGFRGEGRRKNYYDHPKEDAIIMTKEFGAAEAEAQQ